MDLHRNKLNLNNDLVIKPIKKSFLELAPLPFLKYPVEPKKPSYFII